MTSREIVELGQLTAANDCCPSVSPSASLFCLLFLLLRSCVLCYVSASVAPILSHGNIPGVLIHQGQAYLYSKSPVPLVSRNSTFFMASSNETTIFVISFRYYIINYYMYLKLKNVTIKIAYNSYIYSQVLIHYHNILCKLVLSFSIAVIFICLKFVLRRNH